MFHGVSAVMPSRRSITAIASGLESISRKRRPSWLATAPTVPDPAKKSTTRSPGALEACTIRRTTPTACCVPASSRASLPSLLQLGLELPPGPRANLSYRVRLEAGTVGFSDTSRRNPPEFLRLAAFTKDVAERVCGIVR